MSLVVGVLALFILYIISPTNNVVYMIYGGFGNQFILCVLYSILGILGVYFLSVGFAHCIYKKWMQTIGMGSIIILAFQGYFIERIAPRLEILTMGKNALYEVGSIIFSIIIMLIFIPVIRFCQRYVPVVLGKRR